MSVSWEISSVVESHLFYRHHNFYCIQTVQAEIIRKVSRGSKLRRRLDDVAEANMMHNTLEASVTYMQMLLAMILTWVLNWTYLVEVF